MIECNASDFQQMVDWMQRSGLGCCVWFCENGDIEALKEIDAKIASKKDRFNIILVKPEED
jgi:hypothetical protein